MVVSWARTNPIPPIIMAITANPVIVRFLLFMFYRAVHPHGAYNRFSNIFPELFPNLSSIKPESDRRGFTLKNCLSRNLSAPRKKYFGYIIQWMIGGTRGGLNRARLIKILSDSPMNAHQLSQDLGLDYSTIRHHIEVMEKNGLVTSIGDGYGKAYLLTQDMLDNYGFFEEIWEKLGNKEKNDGEDDE